MKILVTGGAGFVGSHLIDSLIMKGNKVICVDDLSLGKKENIMHHEPNDNFKFIQLDITSKEKIKDVFAEEQFGCVFHLAANSDIQMGSQYLSIDLKNTFMTTFNTLECMKQFDVKKLIFASTSAVYGESTLKLTEDSGPLLPVSFYGAAKLSSEAYISAFVANSDIQAWIPRFPNVVGERATHGVVFDFINKLLKNPKELLILGDGKQIKPYMYVKDLVEAILFVYENSKEDINYFNLSVDSETSVNKIAEIVTEEMGLNNVKFIYSGGDRGWIGDVPRFQYDIRKATELGWRPKRTSDDSVRLAVKALLRKRS